MESLEMRHFEAISADMTVRQAALRWPACAPVLESYPDARSAGRWSLQDLRFFARDHGLKEEDFLNELASAARVPVAPSGPKKTDISPTPLIFTALGTCMTLGGGWGVLLLLRISNGQHYNVVSSADVHVHGTAQLWGWMTLFILAIATHLIRQNTKSPSSPWLERFGAGFILAGLACLYAGLFETVRAAFPLVHVVASISLVAAAILFGVSILWSLLGRRQKPLLWHGFVFAMLIWLWTWAGTGFWLHLHDIGQAVLSDSARDLLIALPVLGLATNAVYGFGIRLIPGFLNITRLRPRCFAATLVMHNLGLCLIVLPQQLWHITGAAMMLVASIIYLIGMNGLKSEPSRRIFGIDPRGHVLIRVAFFWLVAGLAMILGQMIFPDLPHAYSGAWRHALTVGFITTMMLGVGQRLIPVFIKQPLASNRMMLIGAAGIIVGNAGRVVFELLTIGKWSWTYRAMGPTGLLELTALLLFGVNLIWTVRNRRHVYQAHEPLRADTRVREAINARPELQYRLRELGITMFDDSPFVAPSLTFGALALAWGMQPEQIIDDPRFQQRANDPAENPSTGQSAGRGAMGRILNPVAGQYEHHRVPAVHRGTPGDL
jgi:hypothetical protein